jgi:hypothetical protein
MRSLESTQFLEWNGGLSCFHTNYFNKFMNENFKFIIVIVPISKMYAIRFYYKCIFNNNIGVKQIYLQIFILKYADKWTLELVYIFYKNDQMKNIF